MPDRNADKVPDGVAGDMIGTPNWSEASQFSWDGKDLGENAGIGPVVGRGQEVRV